MTISQHVWGWVELHLGIARGGPDPWYNFWSGFGSDVGELAIVGGLVAMVRHANCAHSPCWRLSRHVTVDGHKLCRTHLALPLDELNLPVVHPDHQ